MSEPRIRLDCLGSAFAFSNGRYWNGWLLNGRVLLDCPAQTLAHLYRLGHSPADIDLVLLSHGHSDHIAGMDLFLLDLAYRQRERRASPVGVAGPPGIFERLRQLVGDRDYRPRRDDPLVTWMEPAAGDAFEWAGMRAEALAMVHSAPDHGFRIEIDGALVAYTGDTAPGDHIHRLARDADVLIIECGGPWPGVHCDWDDLFELRRELPPGTEMLVTHYDPNDVPDVAGIQGFTLAQDFAVYRY